MKSMDIFMLLFHFAADKKGVIKVLKTPQNVFPIFTHSESLYHFVHAVHILQL